MVKEIQLVKNEMYLNSESLKKIVAGEHSPCSCNNCGTANDNDVAHSNNTPL